MKVSYNWLKDYLKCDLGPEEIAAALTSIGLEVDAVEETEQIPGGLAGVIVAEVVLNALAPVNLGNASVVITQYTGALCALRKVNRPPSSSV